MLSIGTSSTVILAQLTTAGLEAFLLTTPLVSVPKDSVQVVISGQVKCLTGTGTTQVQLRIRRGFDSTGPSLISPWNIDVGAGVQAVFAIQYTDTLINFAQVQYSISAVTVGSSAPSTGMIGSVAAIFLS